MSSTREIGSALIPDQNKWEMKLINIEECNIDDLKKSMPALFSIFERQEKHELAEKLLQNLHTFGMFLINERIAYNKEEFQTYLTHNKTPGITDNPSLNTNALEFYKKLKKFTARNGSRYAKNCFHALFPLFVALDHLPLQLIQSLQGKKYTNDLTCRTKNVEFSNGSELRSDAIVEDLFKAYLTNSGRIPPGSFTLENFIVHIIGFPRNNPTDPNYYSSLTEQTREIFKFFKDSSFNPDSFYTKEMLIKLESSLESSCKKKGIAEIKKTGLVFQKLEIVEPITFIPTPIREYKIQTEDLAEFKWVEDLSTIEKGYHYLLRRLYDLGMILIHTGSAYSKEGVLYANNFGTLSLPASDKKEQSDSEKFYSELPKIVVMVKEGKDKSVGIGINVNWTKDRAYANNPLHALFPIFVGLDHLSSDKIEKIQKDGDKVKTSPSYSINEEKCVFNNGSEFVSSGPIVNLIETFCILRGITIEGMDKKDTEESRYFKLISHDFRENLIGSQHEENRHYLLGSEAIDKIFQYQKTFRLDTFPTYYKECDTEQSASKIGLGLRGL
jgi:hypothetical protein